MTIEITSTTVQPLDLRSVVETIDWTQQVSCSQVRQNVMDVTARVYYARNYVKM